MNIIKNENNLPEEPWPNKINKILTVGDIHGNWFWVTKTVLPVAQKLGANMILQVGDFGYWEHTKEGIAYLDTFNQALRKFGMWCVFVDGNHENFNLLLEKPRNEQGFGIVRSRILHARRGVDWWWNNIHFMAMGGAASYDKKFRIEGKSWWPQELITEKDIEKALEVGLVDVLVTHDAPFKATPIPLEEIDQETTLNETKLQELVDACKPKLVIHGHWHKLNKKMINPYTNTETNVIGLNCDSELDSLALLNLEGLEKNWSVEVIHNPHDFINPPEEKTL